jgi:hypothetical protein
MWQSAHLGNDPTDKAQRPFENKQFEIKFNLRFDSFCIRRQTLDNNMPKAYAFLWEHCTTIQQDPIILLKAANQGMCSKLSRAVIQAYDCVWCHDYSVWY